MSASFDAGMAVGEMVRLGLACLIFWAAVAKAKAFAGFREYLIGLGVSRRVALSAAPAVIAYEAMLGIGLLLLPAAVIGPGVAATFVLFAVIVARRRPARGCGCLGTPRARRASTRRDVVLRLAGASGGVYLFAAEAPPLQPNPRLMWLLVILALAARFGTRTPKTELAEDGGPTRGATDITPEVVVSAESTGRRAFLRRGAVYTGGMVAGTALPRIVSPCSPECPPTHQCVCSSTGQCSCQPKPLPPLAATGTPSYPPPTPTPMPVFDCGQQYAGAMQECDLILTDCMGSCDISSTEPGIQLLLDSLFCLLKQSACIREKTYCADEATRSLEQCCRIGGPLFDGCTNVLIGPEGGATRVARRFKRDSAADYWAAMAHVHRAAAALFDESLARSWTAAHIVERAVPLLTLRRNLAGGAGDRPIGVQGSFLVGESARREIRFIDAIIAAPDLKRTFAAEAGAVREVVEQVAGTVSASLPPAQASLIRRRIAKMEREVAGTRSAELPDYRNAIAHDRPTAEFDDVVARVSRNVRTTLESLSAALPPSIDVKHVIATLQTRVGG
jgi:hypothetical protein